MWEQKGLYLKLTIQPLMHTKLRLVFTISMFFLCFYGRAQSTYWQPQNRGVKPMGKSLKHLDVDKVKVFSLEEDSFKRTLPKKVYQKATNKVLFFPDNTGKLIPFKVEERSVLSPELALKYPEIRSFSGRGVDDKNLRIRFSISHKGIQSMMTDTENEEVIFMQKMSKEGNAYALYSKDAASALKDGFVCKTMANVEKGLPNLPMKLVDDQLLRKYRIAVSVTGEYTEYHGGTVADALAGINATLTRVNEVFETDLGVTLELVTNNDLVIYTDAATDPYSGNLNAEVQNTLTAEIGAENYDVGHLFHEDDNNGNAGFVGSVCVDTRKGSAFSSGLVPEGDLYDLDFVAHELGHQFGANHTWSYESEGSLVQVEPASGSTIMGYAGIVNGNNVASHGDDYFHYVSILQITAYLSGIGCAEEIALTNNPPVIIPSADYIIPKSTAFVLEGSASDVDVTDVLTYTWEQIDNGIVTTATFGPTNPSGANFKSQPPSIATERYFPKLTSVLAGNLTQTNPQIDDEWETASSVEREMNFALTVRDNADGGGQVVFDDIKVNVISAAGPFIVNSQALNEAYTVGTIEEINWDVANTSITPINAQLVDISLSVDGGITFPITLAESVPNDGVQDVLFPGVATTQGRIMVKASDNIFFAVNTANFTIDTTEVVLAFDDGLSYEVCQPDDLVVPFTYQTFLGFNEEVTFSIPDAPVGLGVVFSPTMATANNTATTITFSNTAGVPEGIYPLTVTATSTSITKEVEIILNIGDATFSNAVLSSPIDGFVDAGLSQVLEWNSVEAATSYDIEIATDNLFTNIIDTETLIFTSYNAPRLDAETEYFWRVKPKNECGEGVFSTPFSFTTVKVSCTVITAADIPIEISAIGTPIITSKIIFLEDKPIADINVNLDIEHAFLADLIISLTSPQGTTVVLLSSSCGNLQDINAVFDNEAPVFVCSGSPAISGTIKPLGSLASFNGESAIGEWILEISDIAPSDGGILNAFSLDICVEGDLRPDADEDGVFDDGDDLCLGTPKGAEVNVDGCAIYRFPQDNFSVAISSESCRSNNDGAIVIAAMDESIDYSVTVNGNGTNISDDFTDTYTLNNLASGIYTICIVGTNGIINYEAHCFDVVVVQPDVLGVTSKVSLDGRQTILTLDGASLYNIEINGILFQTEEKEFAVDLKNGNNHLKVYTNRFCQGIFEENYILSDEPIVYPNPFINRLKVYVGNLDEKVNASVYGWNGGLITNVNRIPRRGEIELDLPYLPTGIYFLKVTSKTIDKDYKIIKR